MVHESQDLRFFFCIGAAKSGTTLLARVLDQHPKIVCIWESYAFHPRSNASIFNPTSDSWRRHGFSRSDVLRWSRIWRKVPRSLVRRILRKLTGRTLFVVSSFRETMTAALTDFARRCDATVVGDKWPRYIYHLNALLMAFPSARYIYNVRDPRGLWNSAQQFKGRKRGDELLARALVQDRLVTPYLKLDNFLTIRYEDLVQYPETTCEELYKFLGCEFSPRYLRYERKSDPYPERWDWIPQANEPFDPWHTFKWKERMKPHEVDRVSRQSNWFIEKYHYGGD